MDTAPTFTVRDEGAILFDGMAVGRYHDGKLTVNLGWARLAGLGIVVQADPDVDRKRDGIVLERP